MEKDYEIFFSLVLDGEKNYNIDFLDKDFFVVEKNYPIGSINKYTKRKSTSALLSITSIGNGEEILSPLNDFILRLNELEHIIEESYSRCLYIAQNYWYQCNFELDYKLLGILNKYKINLAISSYNMQEDNEK